MIVAEKLDNDIGSLPLQGVNYREGESGELHLYLLRPLYQDELDQLGAIILESEADVEYIKQDASMLVIRFRKGFDPLAIMATAVSTITSILVAWQLVKDSDNPVPSWIWLAVGGITAALIVTLVWQRKKSGKKLLKKGGK